MEFEGIWDIQENSVMLSSYHLRRWSTLVRVRDEFVCYICSEKIVPRCKSQAHHIYPKSLYPEKAYNLDNGVCVCAECHMPRVHSTRKSWRKFTCFFKRYLKRKKNRIFQSDHQHKIVRK